MIGGIAGDIIGSPYEGRRAASYEFPLFVPTCRFTDDTVMTLAVASALLGRGSYRESMLELGRRHPHAGYGGAFRRWLSSRDPQPYHSYGNGSAMRVGSVPWFCRDEHEVLAQARRSAMPTHDHPEGIKGAEATALCIRMALDGRAKSEIRRRISETFHYDLSRSYDDIRGRHGFDVTCQGTVPAALICFLESRSYEDAVRKAVVVGGDSDTLACITGSIAEPFYGELPDQIAREVAKRLTPDLLAILREAVDRCGAERTRTVLLPLIDARAELEADRGIEVVPCRINQDCRVVRFVPAGGSLDAEAACRCVRAATRLRYGMLIFDFRGRDLPEGSAAVAAALAAAAGSGFVVVVQPPPQIAAVLPPKLGKRGRVMERLEHAVRLAEAVAEQAVRKTWA
jgi:ADP-ribosylglycohydrolase